MNEADVSAGHATRILDYCRFVVWRRETSKKIPMDQRTGHDADDKNPGLWISCEKTRKAKAAGTACCWRWFRPGRRSLYAGGPHCFVDRPDGKVADTAPEQHMSVLLNTVQWTSLHSAERLILIAYEHGSCGYALQNRDWLRSKTELRRSQIDKHVESLNQLGLLIEGEKESRRRKGPVSPEAAGPDRRDRSDDTSTRGLQKPGDDP